jgi:hypothetical protein
MRQQGMDEGPSAIEPEDFILRRCLIADGYYDKHKDPPVATGAFRPNEGDTDGISLYLERLLSIRELILDTVNRTGKPAERWAVIRLRAQNVYAIGLSIVATSDKEDLPGHVIIPQINHIDYIGKSGKRRIKEWIETLVNVGSKNVVLGSDFCL